MTKLKQKDPSLGTCAGAVLGDGNFSPLIQKRIDNPDRAKGAVHLLAYGTLLTDQRYYNHISASKSIFNVALKGSKSDYENAHSNSHSYSYDARIQARYACSRPSLERHDA